MKANQFFAPLRNPTLVGVMLVLILALGWVLGGSDPKSTREFLGIAKYYEKPDTNAVTAAKDAKTPASPSGYPATTSIGSTPVAKAH